MASNSLQWRAPQIAAVALAALPMLYMFLWCAMFVGSLSGAWHPRIGNLDVGTAIQRSDGLDLAGLVLMTLAWLAGLVLIARQRRAGVYAMALASLAHIGTRLRITDGQYYNGQFGLIVILLEMAIITLAYFALRGHRRV